MRIRSIKPEFWVSESIGRLSRDARLLFIGLWSIADDSGRARGGLPYLSGALFPYDADAIKKLPEWFSELEREEMVRRYIGPDGNSYFDIPKWLKHQKIEKPSASKFPSFDESSPKAPRILTEGSPLDQGTGSREQGEEQGEEQGGAGDDLSSLFDPPAKVEAPAHSSPEGSRKSKPPEEPVGFTEFWAAYPNKEKKIESKKIWARMNPDESLRDRILADIVKRSRTDNWIKEKGKYVPDPSTYLNGKRWEDEGSTPLPKAKVELSDAEILAKAVGR